VRRHLPPIATDRPASGVFYSLVYGSAVYHITVYSIIALCTAFISTPSQDQNSNGAGEVSSTCAGISAAVSQAFFIFVMNSTAHQNLRVSKKNPSGRGNQPSTFLLSLYCANLAVLGGCTWWRGGVTVTASDLRSSDRGFDSQSAAIKLPSSTQPSIHTG